MTKRRIIKWLAGLGGLCVILLVAAVLLLPRILDSQAVERKNPRVLVKQDKRERGFRKYRSHVAAPSRRWSYAERRLPSTIRSVEKSSRLKSTRRYGVSSRGTWTFRGWRWRAPRLSVRLPEPGEEPFNIDEIESQIRALLASMATEIPGMIVGVSGGSVEVRIGDRPPVVITGLDGRLVAPPGEMNLQISSRANVFDSLRVEESIDGDTLATKGSIKIEPPPPARVPGCASASSGRICRGRGDQFGCSVHIRGPQEDQGRNRRALRRHSDWCGETEKTVIEGVTFKGVISRDEGIVSAVIQRFDLVSPRLTATGEMTIDPAASTVKLSWREQDLDVSAVRETALKIAGDVGVIEDIFRHVKGGKIPEITVQTAGPSFAELWKNIGVTGTLRDGNILTYPLDIDLDDVDGLFVFSGGIFEAKQFSARSGKMQQSDGTLRLGFEGKNAPFHLDIMVDADAAELHSLLFRVFKDDALRKELSRVRNIEGELSGRLIIGEKIDSLSARVSILKAALRGSYDRIPYPISIKEGQFQYGESKIALGGCQWRSRPLIVFRAHRLSRLQRSAPSRD